MNDSRNNEWVVFPAASLSLAGWALHAPLVSLGAVMIVLVVLGPRVRPLAAGPQVRLRPVEKGPRGTREGRFLHVFQAFSGGEWLSPSPASGAEEGTTEEADSTEDERGSQAYEEFAAGLEEDEAEEISFLPPYASDERQGTDAGSRVRADGPADSMLAGDLEAAGAMPGKMPVPRRFALGTVAIIRRLLEPADVERILVEQRRYPRLRFGDVAVQLELLTEDEVQELLVAQEQGIFTEQEIAEARMRLSEYHDG